MWMGFNGIFSRDSIVVCGGSCVIVQYRRSGGQDFLGGGGQLLPQGCGRLEGCHDNITILSLSLSLQRMIIISNLLVWLLIKCYSRHREAAIVWIRDGCGC